MTAVPIFTKVANPPSGTSGQGPLVGLKIQLASDSSGDYVPVVALDSDLSITIGTVNQGTGGSSAWKVDPSGVTSPVSLASLPALAAGSATIGAVNQGTSPWVVQHPDATSTGNTINSATLNAAYTVTLANGEAVAGFTISGLTASGAILTLEGSAADGVTFSAINEIQASGTMGSTITVDGNYYVNSGGRTKVRLRVSVIGTGTITIASLASAASSRVTVQASLPPGANTIGGTYQAPTSSSSFAITPGSSSALEASHVLKGSAGNLYSLYVVTGATAGYLMTFNATSAPADGAVTPVECIPVPANSIAAISTAGIPPDNYSTGIVAVFSSTGPFTKSASATAFFKWSVQ